MKEKISDKDVIPSVDMVDVVMNKTNSDLENYRDFFRLLMSEDDTLELDSEVVT